MQNIEDLIQRIIVEDLPNSKVSSNVLPPSSSQSSSSKIQIPISLTLLDSLNDLKSLSPHGAIHSPQLSSSINSNSSSSSNTGSTTSTSANEYENKVNQIKDILGKLVQKHIDTPFHKVDLFKDIEVPTYPLDKDPCGEDGDQPIFGLINSKINNNTSSTTTIIELNEFKSRGQIIVNWSSLILKIHQILLQSSIYQKLLKSVATCHSDNSSGLIGALAQAKVGHNKQVSLSSNNLGSIVGGSGGVASNGGSGSPSTLVGGQHKVVETTKSTPVTPTTGSPLLNNTSAKQGNGAVDKPASFDLQQQNEPLGSGSSSSLKNPKQQPSTQPSRVISSSTSASSNNSGGSSFSLSSLLANGSKDQVPQGLKELAERSTKYDQQTKMIPPTSNSFNNNNIGVGGGGGLLNQTPQQRQQTFGDSPGVNPNVNKLPSMFETDPVLLPDGSSYQNLSFTSPTQHSLSMSTPPTSGLSVNDQMLPSSFSNKPLSHTSSIPIPTTSIMSPPSNGSFGGVPTPTSMRISSSPSIPQGIPPTRLTESYFPTSSSRGPPSYDGMMIVGSQGSTGSGVPIQGAPSSMLSVSPSSQSSIRSSGGFMRSTISPTPIDSSSQQQPQQPSSLIQQQSTSSTQPIIITSPIGIGNSNPILSTSPIVGFSNTPNSLTSKPIQIQSQQHLQPNIGASTIVPASSSFKATNNNQSNNQSNNNQIQVQPITNIPTMVDQSLPNWLDLVIQLDDQNDQNDQDSNSNSGILLYLLNLIIIERSGGRLDHLLESRIITLLDKKMIQIMESKQFGWVESVYQNWVKSINIHYHQEVATKLSTVVSDYATKVWTKNKFNHYLNTIVELKRLYPAPQPLTSNQYNPYGQQQQQHRQVSSKEEESQMVMIMDLLQKDTLGLIQVQDHHSLGYIEQLGVGLLGHNLASVRQSAVCLLNTIYDSHDWQLDSPLKPVIRVIGDAFRVELELENPLPEEVLKRLYLLTVTPAIGNKAGHKLGNNTLFTRTKVKVDGNGTKVYYEAPSSFYRAGYYDWRFAELSSTGNFQPFDFKSYKIKSSNSPSQMIEGRFIVHPKLREEIMHEVWIDLQDAVWDPHRGEMSRKGTLQNLIDALDMYHAEGVTTLYVMGLLERLPNSHPFCPTDRELPYRAVGGTPLFQQLVGRAKQLGIKLVVDSTTRLASRAAHRKYNRELCYTLDGKGQLSRLEGTDSAEFTWPDCVMVNMRKLSVWNDLVHETLGWGERGVDGIRVDGGHTCPLIFRSNIDELYRLDSDDLPHYNNQQIFDGEIVMTPSEEGKNFGYWGTTPPSPKQSTPFYPNPLFIKLTREVWNQHPNFVFLAEVYWERELHSIISGLVPYSSAIPRALASVFDKGISKDGIVFDLRQRQSVRALYDYYEMRNTTYPQNSIILFPSSTHHSPYPLQIYNAGAWAAVDMLYFLPEIPITYIGEQHGWYYHVDIHSSRIKIGMSSTPYQLQYPQIRGHYAHRVSLRKNHTLLRRGGMIPLLCYHQSGWHDRVFGFARFSGDELAIIAINFDNHDTEFYVDCSPLAKISTEESNIYRLVDLINPSNPPQYLSLQELLYEKHFVVVPGFSSICWGIYRQVKSPAAVRVLYEHSMTRLKQLLDDNVDPSNNLIYSILKKGMTSVDEFAVALEDILNNLSGNSEKTFASFIQSVLYHLTRSFDGTKVVNYLEYLVKRMNQPSVTEEAALSYSSSRVAKICKDILQQNTLGPIVFITPEIGRFSTVGGVGVMLDELTRSLQLLGVEVHIISPYYNYGKGGRTGYLEKEEGIKWQRNVVTYVGPDKVEVGVHSGVDKGINLHFLHHFEYFPTPYHSGSPIHQLKTIVLFAKASLELLCQIRVLPSVIVTNDWFCGLVPGYARAGAFGTTFNGTTFFHLVHNLEEAYQGRIYPDGNDDLNWIHQLHRDLIMDPYSNSPCLNASRCALLTCNNWGTVSKSYLYDLLKTSHLSNLLHRFPQAFAHSNGIRVKERRLQLTKIASSHKEAKALLQKKYFGVVDDTIPVFSFVGRIVLQKGVHLILNAMRELVQQYQGRIQILVGGMANMKDPYAASCAWSMQALSKQFPASFWADPDAFFSDGALVNLGSDFGLMPSLFEPSGVVQQEYFAAGTPVIAFKTGGLKDTVFEYNTIDESGNGFTFEAHKHSDYVQALHRAFQIFQDPHHYQRIRERCYESVLDMQVVAEAWAMEFARLRKSIWCPEIKSIDQLK